jgi:triphosphoribosyl-dephospho-CoA synthase
VLGGAAHRPVGETVLLCVQRTREVAPSNTNLGIILLLAPLAAAGRPTDFNELRRLLWGLTVDDSRRVYEAIRLASPGGMGKVEEGDVSETPTRPLRELMALAEGRDRIAWQYTNAFRDVWIIAEGIQNCIEVRGALEGGIINVYLGTMGGWPDTLIARKCGEAVAKEAARRADEVLARGWPDSPQGRELFRELDAWLRADGNRRNPGTTADLIAAALFVMLQRGEIELPLRVPWALEDGAM